MKSFAKLILRIVFRKTLNRIKNLHGLERGKKCYIIGDGPSIKWFDLKHFDDRDVITLSAIPLHLQSSSLRIKYCLLTEPWFFYKYFPMPSWSKKRLWKNTINKHYKNYFLSNKDISSFVSLTNLPVLSAKNIKFVFGKLPFEGEEFYEKLKIEGLDEAAGSFVTSIMIALYLGYEDILLIGCDYTHKLTRSLHWYEYGEGHLEELDEYNSDFLNLISKYVKIDTITLSGGGNCLPGIEYTKHTKAQPMYKENHELMDSSILQDFSKWPGYRC